MIRWLLILALLLALIACEEQPASVSVKTERQHMVQVLLHTCARATATPPAQERCHEAGLRAVERLASTPEWAWRER